MDYNINFPERLIKLRKQHNLTLNTIAINLDISNQAISAMEKGRRSPSFEVLIKLALYFNVSIDYLVGLSDEPNRTKDIDILPKAKKQLIESIYMLPDDDIKVLEPIVNRMVK